MTEKTEKGIYQIFEDFNSNRENKFSPEEIIELVDSIVNKTRQSNPEGQVFEFMANFKQDVGFKPHIPSTEDCKFRISLLMEELSELAVACGNTVLNHYIIMLKNEAVKLSSVEYEGITESIEGALDAYADLAYILYGGVHKFGFGNIFGEAFEIVHESNMSKLCSSIDEVDKTIAKYNREEIPVSVEETLFNGKTMYIIKRSSDNKVLKNINYTPADFSRILYNTF